jgi:Tfp pilus assembly protein PilF
MKLASKLAALWIIAAGTALLSQPSPDPLAEARSFLDGGALGQSADLLRRYLNANPSSADAHFLLGYVLFREQKPEESLAEFTAGAKYRRPKADELKTVAADYVLAGDYANADKWLSEVTQETPNDADAWYLLGRTKYSESNFRAAIPDFEHALTLQPRFVEAENNLGLSWREINDLEKAETAFQSAIDWQGDRPTDPQPFLNLGTLLADENQFDHSRGYLEKAIALAPDNPKMHEELAHIFEAQGNLTGAQSELERAVTLAPKASALHYKLGRIYRREGLQNQAKQEFDLCDKLNGTHSSVETPNPPGQANHP